MGLTTHAVENDGREGAAFLDSLTTNSKLFTTRKARLRLRHPLRNHSENDQKQQHPYLILVSPGRSGSMPSPPKGTRSFFAGWGVRVLALATDVWSVTAQGVAAQGVATVSNHIRRAL